MKKSILAALLAFIVACGTMAGTSSIVLAEADGPAPAPWNSAREQISLRHAIDYALELKQTPDYENLIPSIRKEFDAALTAALEIEQNPDATEAEKLQAAIVLSTACNKFLFVKGDKTELQAYYNEVKDLNLDLYEDGTKKDAFIAALKAAFDVLESEESIQVEVDNAKMALQEAREALVKKTTDKAALEKAIQDADSIPLENYISTGKDAFTNALENAKKVYENPDASQQQIDGAVKALTDTQSGLIKKADKTALKEAIEAAEKVDLDGYISSGKQEFSDKLTAAKDLLANEDALQADVDKAAADLKDAQSSLIKTADKTKLDEAIQQADKLTPQDFAAAGTDAYRDFLLALTGAKKVQADPDATQKEVDDATQKLIEAAKAAVKQADKSELEEAIKEAESLTPSTTELDKAIEEAKKVLNDTTLTNMDQEKVDQAAADLKAAIAEWKKAHPDGQKPDPADPDKEKAEKDSSTGSDKKGSTPKTGEASSAAAGILLAAGCASVLTRKRRKK